MNNSFPGDNKDFDSAARAGSGRDFPAARAALAAGEFARAGEILRLLLGLDAANAEVHNAMATALAGAGRPGAAVAHFQEALAIDPEYEDAARGLFEALDVQPEIDKALTRYDIETLSDIEGANKKVLVVSHERSGTHLLINTLAANFGFVCMQIDVYDDFCGPLTEPGNFSAWFRHFGGLNATNVFKSHHPFAFYEDDISRISEDFHIFYVYRDGRDVMTSFWRYANTWDWEEAPQCATVGAFMRAAPSGNILAYDRNPAASMAGRWAAHAGDWREYGAEWVSFIRFEDMLGDFDGVLDTVAGVLGVAPRRRARPSRYLPSVAPWKMGSGNWTEFFAAEDVKYFTGQAGETMSRLGYDI